MAIRDVLVRHVVAVRMKLDANGHKISHRFERAVMRSAASLTYQEVQAAVDIRPLATAEVRLPMDLPKDRRVECVMTGRLGFNKDVRLSFNYDITAP